MSTGSLRWEITDNEIYDARPDAKPRVLEINIADQRRAGSLIDRNKYFVPSGDGKFLVDKAMRISFAQWQAAGFDRNGQVVNLNWRDPANGKF
jgi:hypothetical protein